MKSNRTGISVIVPVFNGERYVLPALAALKKELRGLDYEIIISDGGSSDKTALQARDAMKQDRRIVLLEPPKSERWRKARSFLEAARVSKFPSIFYVDVDMSAEPGQIRGLLKELKDADIAIGSRLVDGSKTERRLDREFLSRFYNFLVRLLFDSKVHDHQCGFKAFRKRSLTDLAQRTSSDHFFWDTEMLVWAQRTGLAVREVPIAWREGSSSTINTLTDSFGLFLDILRFRTGLLKADSKMPTNHNKI
ncbi:MAG: glycosyltransferase [Candidatus Micrarchaeia archaeon]